MTESTARLFTAEYARSIFIEYEDQQWNRIGEALQGFRHQKHIEVIFSEQCGGLWEKIPQQHRLLPDAVICRLENLGYKIQDKKTEFLPIVTPDGHYRGRVVETYLITCKTQ